MDRLLRSADAETGVVYGRVQASPVAVKSVVYRSRFQLLAIDWQFVLSHFVTFRPDHAQHLNI